MVITIDSGG